MGQGPSRAAPEQLSSDRRHRRSALLRPSSRTPEPEGDGESSRLSSGTSLLRRSSTLVRSRLNLPSRLSGVFTRSRAENNTPSPSLPNIITTPSASRPSSGQALSDSQRTIVPPFRRRTVRHEDVAPDQPEEVPPDAQASARRASFRDLGSRLRQSLPQPALRRRSSSMQRGDDHTAMLSRLLSAAAVHTAASIIGEDPARPWSLRGDENGAFDNFLESLQNGSLHSALRQSVAGDEGRPGSPGGRPSQLNFFRMFRLGTVENSSSQNNESESSTARQPIERGNSSTQAQDGGSSSDTRLVPIIIVGIRSINSGNPEDNGFPPFIDALSNLPAATTPSDSAFDGLLPPARNNTSFSHRRRASMGGLANLQSAYDSQRAQHPDRTRPFSATSESLTGPRPPPSTPASAGLSAYPSGATTPTQNSNATGGTTSAVSSRHGSFVRNTQGSRIDSTSALGSNSEESETSRRAGARRRRRSDSDFARYGSGSSRRNGVVGFDPAEDLQEEAQRSWIIYVLGGSYPENHPILSTPSLFSDSPTYEDMLLLSSLIGPAKPPVATEADIARAPGLFRVTRTTNSEGQRNVIATEVQGDGVLTIALTDRCLVCLTEFEEDEMIRQLVKCRHLFHRDCIDQWLTTGRNSCPLCREEGVEKCSETSTPTEAEPMDLSS